MHCEFSYIPVDCLYPRGPLATPIGAAVEEAEEDWINDPDLRCEPVGEDTLAIGSVRKAAAFWRTFVKSSWVLSWIEKGYEL